jgi:glycosyltransferase involved in cell wall biosynthesis
MKKVTIVTNSIGGGGAERAMNLLSNELMDRGYSVTLIPINNSVKDYVAINCEILFINRVPTGGLTATWRSLLKFINLIKRNNPDFVLLNCDLPEFFGLFLKRNYNLIVIEHSNPAWTTRPILGRIVRFLHKLKSTKFLTVSSHLTIWPTGMAASGVVNNIIDATKLGKLHDTSSHRLLRLVFIGRLTKIQKRPSWLIAIGKQLSVPVIFIGQGQEEDNLRNDAEKNQVSVCFLGHQLNPWSHILPGDLLVVPSLFEGDGLVAVEAIAQNLPIILSDIKDFRRFGLPDFFYAHSTHDFISKIEKHRLDISKFIVPETNSHAILEFRTPSKVGDSWERIFKDKDGLL